MQDFGHQLPWWSVIPFVGILLSIAILPLVAPHWWEKHLLKVALSWGVLFLIPFAIGFGAGAALYKILEVILLDYLPFIIMLWGLFSVSGGIVLKGDLVGSPRVNLALIAIGTVLASWIGTTGASMLLIRPVIRANGWRKKKAHVVIFFIFLVSNIGGCLTPVGDPPLFLGFLRHVPFFWTMRLWPVLLFNAVILLFVLFIIDRHNYKMELANDNRPPASDTKTALKVEGLHNLIFLAMIVGAVILSGILSGFQRFTDQYTGTAKGIHLYEDIVFPWVSLIQISIIILAGILSVITTKKSLREENQFTWGPIKEVASLFIGIFIAMIPALEILHAKGADMGLIKPWQFFWSSGALSSFLDNAPTYLVFLTTAGSLGNIYGVTTTIGVIAPNLLMAISAGSVFMGANTYIGNAPNFMVRSIAEESGIKMPSFFGYLGWSLVFLIPLFLIDTFLFFR